MFAILGCLLAAFVLFVGAPRLLTVGRWQLLHPRCALTLWFGTLFAGLALLVTVIVLCIVAVVSSPQALTPLASVALTVSAWAGLGLVGIVSGFLLMSLQPLLAQHRAEVAVLYAHPHERSERAGFSVFTFESEQAVAYAIPGDRACIFVSAALVDLLTPAQLDAVLAHEYAHVRQGHTWAKRIAHINARVHVGEAGAKLRRATSLLVELAADDAAARQAGAANLANALARIGNFSADVSFHLRAERLTKKRWPLPSRRRLPKAFAYDSKSVLPI